MPDDLNQLVDHCRRMIAARINESRLKFSRILPKRPSMALAILLLSTLSATLILLAGCRASSVEPPTLRFLIESSPNNLDLRQGTDAQSERIGALLYEGLARRDEHFGMQPSLALSWDRPDPLTWVFHLRPKVRFHDGTPLTAADVVWSINSMTDGTLITAKAGNFSQISHIRALDSLTVELQTANPDPSLLFNLSDGLFGIVKQGAAREEGLHPIGTGPFRFLSQVQDKEVVLEQNIDYWGGSPHIDRVRFEVVPDNITMALELKKGAADAESNAITPDEVHALANAYGLQTETRPGADVFYANFNVNDPALRDPRVRQAIACAIDKHILIEGLWRGHAVPAETLLPPNHWAQAPDRDLPQYPFDPTRAQSLLDQAGLHPDKHGIRLHFTLKTSTDETTRLLAQVLQQQLRAAGIELDLRSSEFGTFYADITKGAFQMYMLRWTGSNQDPDIFRYAYSAASFPPKGGNRGRYTNPQLDQLLQSAANQTNDTTRTQNYIAVQQTLAHELPSIPLWYPDVVVVHSTRLYDVHLDPGGSFAFLRSARLN